MIGRQLGADSFRIQKQTTLFCFSPAVMLTTFAIEIAAALFVLLRYRTDKRAQLIILILSGLALFQLAEYMVCEGAFGISGVDWARLGYVAITFLPPLGFHLATMIAGSMRRKTIWFGYIGAVAFSGFFLLAQQGVQAGSCMGNYVLFDMMDFVVWPYALYYYGWLLFGTFFAWRSARQQTKRVRAALYGLAIGYASFIVPTTIVTIIEPKTIAGIPSIMCGFAVILAIILLLWVAPRVLKPRGV